MSQLRVDFYLLNSQQPQSCWLLACKLITKAYQQHQEMFVYCEQASEVSALSELLWSYHPEVFTPHCTQDHPLAKFAPIHFGYESSLYINNILLNLRQEVPHDYDKYNRVIEIISGDELSKKQGRLKYQYYRNAQCELHLHHV